MDPLPGFWPAHMHCSGSGSHVFSAALAQPCSGIREDPGWPGMAGVLTTGQLDTRMHHMVAAPLAGRHSCPGPAALTALSSPCPQRHLPHTPSGLLSACRMGIALWVFGLHTQTLLLGSGSNALHLNSTAPRSEPKGGPHKRCQGVQFHLCAGSWWNLPDRDIVRIKHRHLPSAWLQAPEKMSYSLPL